MARIAVSDSTTTYQLKKWLGLNESPDGDTGLKLGEASIMRNFRITRENHLQIRPGYAAMCTLAEGSPVQGIWSGYVNEEFHVLAACGGHLWKVDPDTWESTDLGEIDDGGAFFFGFGGKVYLLTGSEYYVWNGTDPVQIAEGYAPIVVTAAPPEGGGQLLERVNMLTGKKRANYSPDGEATVFQLPEAGIDELLEVEGTDVAYEADLEAGTVTFESAPEKGVNTLMFTWRKGTGERERLAGMRFAEFYNGDTDTRVFLYGDGGHEAFYSDLDENGLPSAEYFPDGNVMAVGTENTPITSMIRHYDRLLAFKTGEAWTAYYTTMTLETGEVTAAFYCTPLNREIGCAGYGQARLIQNNPLTLHGQAVYQWALSNSGTRDERNAKRVSDRVEATLSTFEAESCITFDDERKQEYWICCGSEALIYNYGNDTWYFYNHMPVQSMAAIHGEIYFGTPDGRLMHFSRSYRNDDLEEIDAWWESGSIDFEQDWRRKYTSNIWVSMTPESQCRVNVTVRSNRKADYAEKVVAYGLASFRNANFAHWSFNTNRRPQVERVRIKVKKYTYYKLIFSSVSRSATATILGVDFQVRYTGNVK